MKESGKENDFFCKIWNLLLVSEKLITDELVLNETNANKR
jgi:hypothetical protein